MKIGDINGHLLVKFDDVMVAEPTVTDARRIVTANARDDTEAATFLDMLGIGDDPAWNMGGAA